MFSSTHPRHVLLRFDGTHPPTLDVFMQ